MRTMKLRWWPARQYVPRRADVEQLLDMRTCIECVEEAFRQLADGKAMNVPRRRSKSARNHLAFNVSRRRVSGICRLEKLHDHRRRYAIPSRTVTMHTPASWWP